MSAGSAEHPPQAVVGEMDRMIDKPSCQRLTLISAVAVRAEIEELVPQFERLYGVEVEVRFDVNPAVARRIIDGEAFDVGLTNPWFFDEMKAAGRVTPDIHFPFGRVPLTIGAAGTAPESIANSVEDVRRILSDAESVAFIATGTSGKTFLKAIEILGLREALEGRLRPMGSGEPPIAVASGHVQYAVAPMSRLIAAPGVSPIATFPSELALDIEMSMFRSKDGDRELPLQLIRFLSSPTIDDYLISRGVYR